MDILKGKTTWIDIQHPTESDILWLKTNFKFHSVVLDELLVPSRRAKVDANKSYVYLIYYFPIYDEQNRVSRRSEIDILITKDTVITVRYETNPVIDELKKSLSEKNRALEDSMHLAHKILETLMVFQQRQLVHIHEKVQTISEEIFKDREKQRERDLLERISYLKRDISQLQLIVRPQRHILESFLSAGCGFFGPNCQVYVNDLIGEHLKVIDQLDGYREAIEDFENTNVQLINLKNSQVVKTFTILAFLTFPMMLFAALFSMNTRNNPIVGHAYDFWIILSVMAVCMSLMYSYFRKKDWL